MGNGEKANQRKAFKRLQSSQIKDDLIRRVQEGDARAWEEFYAQYFHMVSFAVKKYVKTGTGAEDLVQEVFINLFTA